MCAGLSEEALLELKGLTEERNEFLERLVEDLITRRSRSGLRPDTRPARFGMEEAMLLDQIKQPNDIKKISPRDYPALAAEIREFLVNKISVTGGHLGSNLGAVELTMGASSGAGSAPG